MNDISIDWSSGRIAGNLQTSSKTLGEMRAFFHDQNAAQNMPEDLELYRVHAYMPVPAGTEGGLYWGNTVLQPGKIGDEYFMTKGHFHRIRNRAEYYLTFCGAGALLLMDEAGVTRYETMSPGSVHYIPGNTAHRVANTGSVPLVFAACWPSDAGYDYETIEREGFSARLIERSGSPVLVPRKADVVCSQD
ncbi:MAG TPA: glucose-6-phosphate isomerase family protein [Acidobacteriaceae bacterium]|nr:glucose-6-phosphate isomerase family protein [Acidobacteriaceae bacterium]